MSLLPATKIAELLQPYIQRAGERTVLQPVQLDQLQRYLDLLVHWNARTNLTAIRDPETIVCRHFGESLFVAVQMRFVHGEPRTLLDFGSGAGFPGVPIQIACAHTAVTLAESQRKKVAFLREVVRELGLPTQVWPARVEAMPVDRSFDVVALRAVDRMAAAIEEAHRRVQQGGYVAVLTSGTKDEKLWASSHSTLAYAARIPHTDQSRLEFYKVR